jgi:transcription antitermination factor NusG
MRKHHQGLEGRIVQVIDGLFTGFRGEVKEVEERTAKVGRSGIWPRNPDRLGT